MKSEKVEEFISSMTHRDVDGSWTDDALRMAASLAEAEMRERAIYASKLICPKYIGGGCYIYESPGISVRDKACDGYCSRMKNFIDYIDNHKTE